MELTDISNDKQTPSINTESDLNKLKELFGQDNVMVYDGAYLIPQLGKLKWDGHIYISGATGSGKSYLIRQIVENDLKNRKIYLFSNVHNDPSLKGLSLNKYDPKTDSKNDSIFIFDDYNDKTLRDELLETGRHTNTMAIVVNHKHRQWAQTMKPLNESKYVILFPSANKGVALQEMKQLGMNRKQRVAITEFAQRDGRYMIIHQHAPNAIVTQQTIVKL